MKPILNVADAPIRELESGEHFACRLAQLAHPLGAKSIGANVTRVPPGKAAFPFHHHYANEEHFFILSGSGTLRVGSQTYPVGPHDYIFTPPGGPETAHQLVNTGHADLVYLAISTLQLPEVAGYPDSGKTGIRVTYDAPSGSAGNGRFLIADTSKDEVSYWDGEDGRAIAQMQTGTPAP
ncbi:cupin domain-containing protein [Gloeobacter morelensis]|uniref:Cupin domain-containing protein n=1 Tax=Gloeobacter morelensis MG652769 TaxID=2781736 RepID=A0ABY3PI74_9CYAN|nr:cupin domain-containing protein [Gloeobacter morelensis]UFP93237.1 cupin domain-containing protein [Gloeobacter morelensis MG652769]